LAGWQESRDLRLTGGAEPSRGSGMLCQATYALKSSKGVPLPLDNCMRRHEEPARDTQKLVVARGPAPAGKARTRLEGVRDA